MKKKKKVKHLEEYLAHVLGISPPYFISITQFKDGLHSSVHWSQHTMCLCYRNLSKLYFHIYLWNSIFYTTLPIKL